MHFHGFYGNNAAIEWLSASLDSGRIPHAILLDGPAGCGKRTFAKIIAAACICESAENRPCGNCRSCKNVFSHNHPDIITVSGGSGARSFSVDTVRKMRLEAYIRPNEAMRKIYILENIHNMTEQAQNALLKILEEPPSFVMFILTCDSRSRVLETIQSRCQIVSIAPVSEDEAAEALLEQVDGLGPDKATKAARLAGGNIGKAKKGLESGEFDEIYALCSEFVDGLCGNSEYDFLKLSGKLDKNTELFDAFVELLPLFFRDAAVKRQKAGNELSGCSAQASKLASRCTLKQIYSLLSASIQAHEATERYANHTLLLTWMFSEFWVDAHS